jgi:hypothetical protein
MTANDLLTLLQTLPERDRQKPIVMVTLTFDGIEVAGDTAVLNVYKQEVELIDSDVVRARSPR